MGSKMWFTVYPRNYHLNYESGHVHNHSDSSQTIGLVIFQYDHIDPNSSTRRLQSVCQLRSNGCMWSLCHRDSGAHSSMDFKWNLFQTCWVLISRASKWPSISAIIAIIMENYHNEALIYRASMHNPVYPNCGTNPSERGQACSASSAHRAQQQ